MHRHIAHDGKIGFDGNTPLGLLWGDLDLSFNAIAHSDHPKMDFEPMSPLPHYE